ncbi:MULTISPECIES: Ldh family oxidoreductase [unclassified Oceanispirochaeta]|uniref:Ldh family oxidoreductase n=1 Tax=unclassified Oceanispirochaeta TaxID=2635722 RepID=UPI000E09D329|nr:MULTISPECIES: Ldh family oxidoreductase [unclassified Oceanispirochaeta]MBF9018110.1 Ldh family oxidoreductase [Oceanispirochaeta sp. M2]NPD74574.1 hypothetical protein [Oceanispirochaeta sp. M1]RDG29603.1 hypothetical protein DV872_20950 [Oceanispirochaeta sp. M1]
MEKIKVYADQLKKNLTDALCSHGLDKEGAAVVAGVYYRATLRGVGHHEIDSLPDRYIYLDNGQTNPRPDIKKIGGMGAMELYDGDNGMGELCTMHVTEKSMDLAKEHGIGFATIRNSNHFLAAAPYTEYAEEKGFFTTVMSKSPAGLSLPGADKDLMGNNPFGYSASADDSSLLFDICFAYSSYGKMGKYIKEGKSIPEYWGRDKEGKPTTNPQDVMDSQLFMPMAEHKGFGLAIWVEMMSSVLAGGNILNQDENETGLRGNYSQTAISINVEKLLGPGEFS